MIVVCHIEHNHKLLRHVLWHGNGKRSRKHSDSNEFTEV